MGVSVQRYVLSRDNWSQPRAHGPSKRSRIRRRLSRPVAIELPEDVLALKQNILTSHPTKLTRFSLSHMRHMVIPPVLIPKKLNDSCAMKTVVSGKCVPLTMRMWKNCKKKIKLLDKIAEHVTYR
ncbi:uncharacterized protein PHALS_06215 [Plasmopara halstedii]|uniref:Uncharacterized protein n=1 Tax=Plasmopara halstedii TaxID=4781 RepID=A0A0P1B0X9_PLAHL|nr:uncharacterized protein PHALS_06215 [Plasmopara halstedii]CEG48390.1 hypothetical protein PHALS_06215 [Plasmopara halstedii]|eukprot:XP_024584759.1 hypothetical protein PHALS_06215 [Plasmopara halstedii]